MALLSTRTRLKLPALDPPTLETVSQQSHLIPVADASVSLSNHIKLFSISLDKRLSFDIHISDVCSTSYFRIRALRQSRSFFDLESNKSIALLMLSLLLQYPPTTESS